MSGLVRWVLFSVGLSLSMMFWMLALPFSWQWLSGDPINMHTRRAAVYIARNIVLSSPVLVCFFHAVVGLGWVDFGTDFGWWRSGTGLCDVALTLAVTDTAFYTAVWQCV